MMNLLFLNILKTYIHIYFLLSQPPSYLFKKSVHFFFYYYFLEFEANVQLYLESGIENAG